MKTKKTVPDFVPGVLLSLAALLFLKVATGVNVPWLVVISPAIAAVTCACAAVVLHLLLLAAEGVLWATHSVIGRFDGLRAQLRAKSPDVTTV